MAQRYIAIGAPELSTLAVSWSGQYLRIPYQNKCSHTINMVSVMETIIIIISDECMVGCSHVAGWSAKTFLRVRVTP